MLSKVLPRRSNASDARPFVFPDLAGFTPGVDIRASFERFPRPAEKDADDAPLREKLRQLESQSAVDRREAFEAGRQQGEQQARTDLQPVIERLNASIAGILEMRPDIRRRAEQDVVQLALLIAKRVLHRQLMVDTDALTALARVAFERLARSESWSVTVHPQFAAAITAALTGPAANIRIEPDPACAPGTLIMHSSDGRIDASIDTQLEEIERGLTDRLAAREA